MTPVDLPENYLLFNSQVNKSIALVVVIDGVTEILSNRPVFSRINYGDAGVNYGGVDEDGNPWLYGGLRRVPGNKDILSLDGSSLTISQKIEPERGKGAVSLLTLAFIDKDQFMSRLVGGVTVPEILGRAVEVFLGYAEISYPQDYFRIFRGYISGVTAQAGLVTLQLSDPNIKQRQELFFSAKTALVGAITDVQTSITVASTGDFHKQILGPDATFDSAIKTYIKIDDEFMEYGPTGITSSTTFTVTRGARGTTAVAHDDESEVQAWVQVEDHAIDMTLKFLLSGFGGNWLTGAAIISIVDSTDVVTGNIPNALILPDKIDADVNYGLTTGDYVTIVGGVNNGITGRIVRFQDLFDQKNRVIVLDTTLTLENPTSATLSFRSQYDTYPSTLGLKLTPRDVDTNRYVFFKQTFLNASENSYRFLISDASRGKEFIEAEIFLPLGAYSLTRNGRVSMGLTRPPIADQRLEILTENNVTEPASIQVFRALNNRKFFNQINFTFDFNDEGTATSLLKILDSDSLNEIGIVTPLPVVSRGARTDLGIVPFFERRAFLLLSRFRRGAVQINLKVNWEEGSIIEAGDIVAIQDDGTLQITNLATGERDLGTQLFEVIDRNLDIKNGNSRLTLISGLGSEITDRYATISPSSELDTGSTTTTLIIKDSFGAIFPDDEARKWEEYLGLPILVHNESYSFTEEVTLISIDPGNRNKLNISPISSPPPAGYIIDIPNYPDTTDPAENRLYKLVHCSFDPQFTVVSGVSATSFNLSAPDAARLAPGVFIRVHSDDFSLDSGDVKVLSVVATLVTTQTSLGFTPIAGHKVDLNQFKDSGGPYRWV